MNERWGNLRETLLGQAGQAVLEELLPADGGKSTIQATSQRAWHKIAAETEALLSTQAHGAHLLKHSSISTASRARKDVGGAPKVHRKQKGDDAVLAPRTEIAPTGAAGATGAGGNKPRGRSPAQKLDCLFCGLAHDGSFDGRGLFCSGACEREAKHTGAIASSPGNQTPTTVKCVDGSLKWNEQTADSPLIFLGEACEEGGGRSCESEVEGNGSTLSSPAPSVSPPAAVTRWGIAIGLRAPWALQAGSEYSGSSSSHFDSSDAEDDRWGDPAQVEECCDGADNGDSISSGGTASVKTTVHTEGRHDSSVNEADSSSSCSPATDMVTPHVEPGNDKSNDATFIMSSKGCVTTTRTGGFSSLVGLCDELIALGSVALLDEKLEAGALARFSNDLARAEKAVASFGSEFETSGQGLQSSTDHTDRINEAGSPPQKRPVSPSIATSLSLSSPSAIQSPLSANRVASSAAEPKTQVLLLEGTLLTEVTSCSF